MRHFSKHWRDFARFYLLCNLFVVTNFSYMIIIEKACKPKLSKSEKELNF